MSNIKNWYVSNQDAITWFVIGWLCQSFLYNIASGDLFWSIVTAVLIYFNYTLRKVRLQ